MLYDQPRLRPVGDTGILVEYGDAIDPEINLKIRVVALALEREKPSGIVEVIPSYRSLLIVYDPLETDLHSVELVLASVEGRLDRMRIPPPRTIHIPVLYAGESGPDIEFVARFHGLRVEDVIRIHSATIYRIYMIGFTPGFAYLGGLSAQLHTPRLDTPRPVVRAGSVGIANNQTGIYPVDSPGGWRLIGRTPLKVFDPDKKVPFLYRAGDLIKFTAVSKSSFMRIERGGAV